jgi:protein ImuB
MRFLPAESHIPERAFSTAVAAYSVGADWRTGHRAIPRPITLLRPKLLHLPPEEILVRNRPPAQFYYGGKLYTQAKARGAERLAPEWWWDDPNWRSGPRDYWEVATQEGPRLWMFCTVGAREPGWFLQGVFA